MTETLADGRLVFEAGTVARLTLSAPASRNAMTRAMWAALPPVMARIAADPGIRALVLTGAGGAFCAGADIAEFAEVYASPESAAAYNATVRAAIAALRDLPRPVLARIEGPCVGGGVALALACDLRFADPGAVFAITPARLGIAYSPADTALVVAAVGSAAAKDLLFSARRIGAAEARAMGLVDRLCEQGGLDPAVDDYAETLARLSPASIAQAKATVNALAPACADPALLAGFAALFSGSDFAEGRAAFLARRAPEF
jgi:enoyl-CoA hydratase/carnithine racemase